MRIAAGNGPGPSGTWRSRRMDFPPGRVNSTSFLSRGAPARVAAQAIASMRIDLRMEEIVSVSERQRPAHGPALVYTELVMSRWRFYFVIASAFTGVAVMLTT